MNHPIFKAISKGHIKNIKSIVEEGCNLNQVFHEDEGKTPLMAAVEQNNQDVIQTLLDLGSDLYQVTELRGDNVVTWCSKWGTPSHFIFLANQMENQFDIDYANTEGNTSLMLAATYGLDDMIKTIWTYHPSLVIKNVDQEDVFDILNNSFNDRESTKKELVQLLTQTTITKMKLT